MSATNNASKNAAWLAAAMLIAYVASPFAAPPGDACDGIHAALPQPLALAASWDPALVREVHSHAARQAFARGCSLVLAPTLDVARDARRGRVERTFGEDPYLVGEMGAAAIEGLQGRGATPGPDKVTAAAMHLAGPSLPGEGSEVGPVPVAERELREVYFPPFEAAIARANLRAIVVSGNELDGIPSLVNTWLLKDVLRGEWKYTGALLASTDAVANLHTVHGVATDASDAFRIATEAGIESIDRAWSTEAAPLDASARTLALKAAQRSIVLLKNDGTLPAATAANVLVIRIGEGDAASQQARVDAARATGRPVVVVLTSPRSPITVKMSEQANAVLAAWNLGDTAEAAIADVLSGRVNPGGKLPLTIVRNAGQMPTFYNVKPSARRGYLFDTTDPLYAFGSGLGYSSFTLGAPKLSAATIDAKGSIDATVEVRNTGKVAGDETVQLYIRDKVSSVTRPVLELKGFQRVTLKPGEARTVTFKVDARSLSMWNEKMQRVVEPGDFEIMTGPSSTQLQTATLTVRAAP